MQKLIQPPSIPSLKFLHIFLESRAKKSALRNLKSSPPNISLAAKNVVLYTLDIHESPNLGKYLDFQLTLRPYNPSSYQFLLENIASRLN